MLSLGDQQIFFRAIAVIHIFIPFCGIFLHVLLLYAFWKDPLKCLNKLGTVFVINLAVSDFLFNFVVLIWACISTAVGLKDTLFFLPSFTNAFKNISFLTIASISVDRLLLVVCPIKHRYWIKKEVIAVWISLIWLVCISYSLKRLILGIEENYEELLHDSLIVLLLSLTSVVYVSVYIALKRKLKTRTELNEGNEHRHRGEELRQLKEKKFLKTIILITSITFVSFGPWWILLRVQPENVLRPGSLSFWTFVTIHKLLLLTNFAINPLIYIFRFPIYRKTFRILFCRK